MITSTGDPTRSLARSLVHSTTHLPLMSDAAQSSPIASKARECVQLFESLADLSRDWGSPVHGIDQEQVLEHHGQLRIWASNVGALQSRTTASSLDHRLRDAPKFSAEVVSLLEDLAETLEDGE